MDFEYIESEEVKPSDFLSPEDAAMQKSTRLEYLRPGDRFVIVGLEDHFRNLYLVRASDCSATVKGEVKPHSDEPFKRLSPGYSMALSTTVKRV